MSEITNVVRPEVAASLDNLRYLVFEGMKGEDGFSPTVTITDITGGHRVTITDADHPNGQSFDVMDGEDGEDAGLPAVTASDNGKIMKVYNGAWALGDVPNGVRFATYGTTTADELFGSAASHPYLCVYSDRVYYLTSYGEEALPGTSPTQYRRFAEFASFGYAGAFRLTASQVNHGYTTWNNYTLPSLPAVTSSDNGKILKVVNGVWAAVDPNA